MNQKEISELKRRFRLGKNAMDRIQGCYVNKPKEVAELEAVKAKKQGKVEQQKQCKGTGPGCEEHGAVGGTVLR